MDGGKDGWISTSFPAVPKTLQTPPSLSPFPTSRSPSSSATCRATHGAHPHVCAHVCTDTRALAHAHQQQELLGFTAGFGHGEDAAVGGRVGAQKPDPGGVPVLVSLQGVLQGCGESRVPRRCTHACIQRNPLCAHVSPAHPRVCIPHVNTRASSLKCVLTHMCPCGHMHTCTSASENPTPAPPDTH